MSPKAKRPGRTAAGRVRVAILWEAGPVKGAVEISNGKLAGLRVAGGRGSVRGGRFAVTSRGPCRLEVAVVEARMREGISRPTLVTVRAGRNPFTFFLRDLSAANPIYIPAYGVAVTVAEDPRPFADVACDIRGRGLATSLQQIALEPEECYENAAAVCRDLRCPTWLGVSRNIRLFEVGWDEYGHSRLLIKHRFHGTEVHVQELDNAALFTQFLVGRGAGCAMDVTRRLEDGVLPILHSRLRDGDVVYDLTALVTLERGPLAAQTLRGTHFLVADGHGAGHMFTPEQQKQYESLLPGEMDDGEETVLCVRETAVNVAPVPRYAWFAAAAPAVWKKVAALEPETGFSVLGSGRVSCVSRLNGLPLPAEEMAVLLAPGEAAVLEFFLPHRPVSRERAAELARFDFDQRHMECRAFWRAKLRTAAGIRVPERRIEEMTRAGLLHLDTVAYGREPDGTIAPTIGVYCPIGTESSPIIQFIDSMGWHDVARRALQYFLDKQHEDGFIQNFGGYEVETGAALWSMGEHYRYTRDDDWVSRIAPKLLKSCEYLLRWRRRSQREELRKRGYGMIDGKVADPNDPVRYFMNSGCAYVGIKRVAEMLARTDPARSRKLAAEAEAFRDDIRATLLECLAVSPVVPLRDGSWCPTAPPWAEYRGPVCLYADGGACFTHGAFCARDSLLGPLYLILHEVVDPDEPAADFIVNAHAELFTLRNAAFSQPYYTRHDIAHLRRGEVAAFLKTYYNQFAGLADRETYTFWEHFFHASPHKTHEEGWFLMQTRWMLYLEKGDTLRLLPGVPRAWLEDGKAIELSGVASYFGPVSLRVESKLRRGVIEASVECRSDRQPACVELRLPHPLGLKARSTTAGTYDPERECVSITGFKDRAEVTLRF